MVRPIASQMRRKLRSRHGGRTTRGEELRDLERDAFDPSLKCGSKKPNRRPSQAAGPLNAGTSTAPTRRVGRNVAGALSQATSISQPSATLRGNEAGVARGTCGHAWHARSCSSMRPSIGGFSHRRAWGFHRAAAACRSGTSKVLLPRASRCGRRHHGRDRPHADARLSETQLQFRAVE